MNTIPTIPDKRKSEFWDHVTRRHVLLRFSPGCQNTSSSLTASGRSLPAFRGQFSIVSVSFGTLAQNNVDIPVSVTLKNKQFIKCVLCLVRAGLRLTRLFGSGNVCWLAIVGHRLTKRLATSTGFIVMF